MNQNTRSKMAAGAMREELADGGMFSVWTGNYWNQAPETEDDPWDRGEEQESFRQPAKDRW